MVCSQLQFSNFHATILFLTPVSVHRQANLGRFLFVSSSYTDTSGRTELGQMEVVEVRKQASALVS